MAARNLLKRSQTRVFTLEGGASPAAVALYQGLGRALSPDQAGGEVTPIRGPSSTQYGAFDIIDEIVGQEGLPTISLEMRMRRAMSDMLTLFQKKCPVDLHIHAGVCTDPTDFLTFETAWVYEGARMTNYGGDELGAFDGDQEGVPTETLPFTARDMYQLKALRDSELAAGDIAQEIVGITVCDSVSCGQCGAPSDGASVFFAIQKSHGGSPGLPAELIFSADGGATIGSTIVDTIGADEDPTDLVCVGTNLVIISAEDNALHYAPIADILAGTESWTRVDTGFVALKLPNRLFNAGRAFTWIAADDGYIFFTADITAGVTPQTSGSLTTQDLQDIHGIDEENLIAVGDSNALLVTTDGQNWSAVTGPAVGVNLTACWMRSTQEWLVGDANGQLWYTRNAGLTWTEKTFSGSGAGTVKAIAFATSNVGYLSHTTAAGVGRIFRTIDGGASWQLVPGGGVSLTDNDGLNRIAVAPSAPANIRANLAYVGGLGADATDGILLKLA